jgi:hypothetical protein
MDVVMDCLNLVQTHLEEIESYFTLARRAGQL